MILNLRVRKTGLNATRGSKLQEAQSYKRLTATRRKRRKREKAKQVKGDMESRQCVT
jgi:hypothetical protein